MKYLAFVFWVGDYDNIPSGGWFDFVGARRTLDDARETVEDHWDRGDRYQIVNCDTLKVVEEGEVYNTGSITFEERDRNEKAQQQAAALKWVGWKPTAPRSCAMPEDGFQYGDFLLRRDL